MTYAGGKGVSFPLLVLSLVEKPLKDAAACFALLIS